MCCYFLRHHSLLGDVIPTLGTDFVTKVGECIITKSFPSLFYLLWAAHFPRFSRLTPDFFTLPLHSLAFPFILRAFFLSFLCFWLWLLFYCCRRRSAAAPFSSAEQHTHTHRQRSPIPTHVFTTFLSTWSASGSDGFHLCGGASRILRAKNNKTENNNKYRSGRTKNH